MPIRDTGPRTFGQRHPLGVTAGHHLCPRRRADRGGVEAGELHPFGRHAVQAGRAIELRAEGADVAVTHIVDEDHDEIGPRRSGCRVGSLRGNRAENQGEQCQQDGFHRKGPRAEGCTRSSR